MTHLRPNRVMGEKNRVSEPVSNFVHVSTAYFEAYGLSLLGFG